ncbi:MAG: DNA-binding protein [Woeseia sp.]|nr:phage antirepressor KilAC domain-containing protein [Woeseia sp.]NNE61477.1 DNA-binding protein [Woeseia sp.]NNL55228.1 DNA-binding protein [Woeseia sp.]
MRSYDFALSFALPANETQPDDIAERCYSQGCDDALIGIGQHGRVGFEFTREASSALQAITSALADVQRIVPGARLIEASPDLVGLTDIANLLGVSRQNMRKFLVRNGSQFPLPVHEGNPAIWHLATVLEWFADMKGRTTNETLLDIARVNMHCNVLKDVAELDASITAKFTLR